MGAPIRVVHDKDPAQEIRDDVGKLCEGITVLGASVLIVMYQRVLSSGGGERRSTGGILIPITANTSAHEDKFQGKVGLLMQLGPIAFAEDDSHKWGGRTPKVGDWVLIDVKETYSFDLPVYSAGKIGQGSPDGERRARIIQDVYVHGIVDRTMFDAIW